MTWPFDKVQQITQQERERERGGERDGGKTSAERIFGSSNLKISLPTARQLPQEFRYGTRRKRDIQRGKGGKQEENKRKEIIDKACTGYLAIWREARRERETER